MFDAVEELDELALVGAGIINRLGAVSVKIGRKER